MSEALRDDVSAPDTDLGDTDVGEEEHDYADPDASGPGLPPPTAVESLVNALIEAGPDVAEHVVKAAQELLLAVQAIVDAADRAVQEQQQIRAERLADEGPEADAPAAQDPANVRHLDLAE